MRTKMKPVTEVHRKRRATWMRKIFAEIEKRHSNGGGHKVSLRELSRLIDTSHQTPAMWLEGSFVPTDDQVRNLAKKAGANLDRMLVEAAYLRATDPEVMRAYNSVLRLVEMQKR